MVVLASFRDESNGTEGEGSMGSEIPESSTRGRKDYSTLLIISLCAPTLVAVALISIGTFVGLPIARVFSAHWFVVVDAVLAITGLPLILGGILLIRRSASVGRLINRPDARPVLGGIVAVVNGCVVTIWASINALIPVPAYVTMVVFSLTLIVFPWILLDKYPHRP